jgi:hypothetical protein
LVLGDDNKLSMRALTAKDPILDPERLSKFPHNNMAKSKSAKRKRNALAGYPHKLPKLSETITPPPDPKSSVEPKSLLTLVSDEELETTIDTLALLSDYLNIIKSKACKDF